MQVPKEECDEVDATTMVPVNTFVESTSAALVFINILVLYDPRCAQVVGRRGARRSTQFAMGMMAVR